MENEKLLSILESVLFTNGEPLKKSKLAKVLETDLEKIEILLDALSARYEAQGSGLVVLKKGEEVQLVSKAENAQFVEKLVKSELTDSLSNAAMEVVSIIAYRGPISKNEIEAIRGVNCSYTLRSLLLRGLIERSENSRDLRGFVYSISFDFLKKMGVDSVKKLPQYDILSVDQRINSLISKE